MSLNAASWFPHPIFDNRVCSEPTRNVYTLSVRVAYPEFEDREGDVSVPRDMNFTNQIPLLTRNAFRSWRHVTALKGNFRARPSSPPVFQELAPSAQLMRPWSACFSLCLRRFSSQVSVCPLASLMNRSHHYRLNPTPGRGLQLFILGAAEDADFAAWQLWHIAGYAGFPHERVFVWDLSL